MELEIFALTLLEVLHIACSFSGDTKYFYGTGALLDFDEEDPFFESVSKPEEISPMELRWLKLRRPRDTVHGIGKAGVPFVEDKINTFNVDGFDDDTTKERGSISRRLEFQNLKKADASFDIKNPFLDNKQYLLNVIVTPYTRSNLQPNFLYTIGE